VLVSPFRFGRAVLLVAPGFLAAVVLFVSVFGFGRAVFVSVFGFFVPVFFVSVFGFFATVVIFLVAAFGFLGTVLVFFFAALRLGRFVVPRFVVLRDRVGKNKRVARFRWRGFRCRRGGRSGFFLARRFFVIVERERFRCGGGLRGGWRRGGFRWRSRFH